MSSSGSRSSGRSVTVYIPNIILRSTLKASTDRLHYCHINGGSLPPKIDEFRSYFEGTNLDIVVASETWLKSYHSDKFVAIEGFEVVRNDRRLKRSGGVILYVREGLNYRVLKLSENVSSEYIFIEVIFPDSKILVGAYYKAPKVDELDDLKEVLLEVTVSYQDIILLGDFNENYLGAISGTCTYCRNGTCSKCEFADIVEQFDLKSVGDIPSHYPIGKRSSLIDLCLTNRPDKAVFFNQISHGLSNHDLIFGSYLCNKRRLGDRPRFKRDFFKVDLEALSSDAASVRWDDIFVSTNATDKVEIFNARILSLLDSHAPLLPVKPKVPLITSNAWV